METESLVNDIDNYIKAYKIFTETSSLTHKSAKKFYLNYLSSLLQQYKNKLIIPLSVVKEIELMKKSSDEKEVKKGDRGLNIINTLQKENLILIVGDSNDPPFEKMIKRIFIDLSEKYKICLITQSKNFVKKIYKMRENKGTRFIKEFKAFRIKNKETAEELNKDNIKTGSKNREIIKKFKLCSKAINLNNSHKINVRHIPVINDYILIKRPNDPYAEKLVLKKEIGKGGEGKVYLADNGLVCKIYNRNKISTLKKEKLDLMLSNNIDYEGICWPISLAYNTKGEFVGYFMNKAQGKELQKSVFIKPLLKKHFPHWTRKHLLTLCLNILNKISYLHKRNVIIGDINPLNILVESETEVYFVDTDSYQIESYPCPVGTINFTPPELQGKDYKKFLRTFENEYFAIATLIFMILMPGKPPYSKIGGSDPATNIKEVDFSYPYGQDKKKDTPQGAWIYIWSHLPRYIKSFIFEVFSNNERKDASEWIKIIKRYRNDLDKRENLSDEIFPDNLKPRKSVKNKVYNNRSNKKIIVKKKNSYNKNE
ncbi:MAG: protein kinase domain-containing protein, partial [bacterium]